MTTPERTYQVRLYGQRIGLLYVRNTQSRFLLERDYVEDPNRAVLGLRFEEDLHAQYRSNVRLPPWFSNLLPEGQLRDWIAEQRGVAKSREVELLAEVGHDLPGAVTVLPTDIEAPDVAAGREVVAKPPEQSSGDIWRFSLAGVALKFSMLRKGERFSAPTVRQGGDWIVKLPDPQHEMVPSNEYAMMRLADMCGIDVPDIQLVHRDYLADVPETLWSTGEDHAYAIRRFDRGNQRAPIHIEDLAQVRNFYPDDKYNGSFETVAALIYRGRDLSSLREFVRRLAFNILIGNGDAHLKNWSLIYENPRIPRLSPAYDIVATAIYRPRHKPEDLGLRFGGTRRFESVRMSDFAALESKLHLKSTVLTQEVADLVPKVLHNWSAVAELLASKPTMRGGIEKHIHERSTTLLRA